MPPITYRELYEKRKKGQDLFSQKNKDPLRSLVNALTAASKDLQRSGSKLNTRTLDKFKNALFDVMLDPAKMDELTDKEKQHKLWHPEDPVRPLDYVNRNRIEDAMSELEELGDFLGKEVPEEFTNTYNHILNHSDDPDIIADGLRLVNDVLQLGLPLEQLEKGDTVQSTSEQKQERQKRIEAREEGQRKREQKLKDWESNAQKHELEKKKKLKRAEELERKEIEDLTKKQLEEEKKRKAEEQKRKDDEAKSKELREKEERQHKEQARQKALSDRQNLHSNMEKSIQQYRDPNASPEMKKINMAMAVAFHEEFQRMDPAGDISMDTERVKQDMSNYYNSAAFAIAESKGTLDELTAMDPADLRKKIIETEREVTANHPEGAPQSHMRAGKLFRQFDATWRIKKNSHAFEDAKAAMRAIMEKEGPATRAEQYVAAETVKKYVAKNLKWASSATGRERMAISLAFLKQTMLPEKFKAYCTALNAQRHAAGDTSEKRRIDPNCIGTVDEVYAETRERIRTTPDDARPDPRDLAMLTALSSLKKRGGGDKAVEQASLQEEIEKVQASPDFKKAVAEDSTEALVNKAFYGALDTVDGYAKPAPTGPVANVQAQM